jgi:hypothetical protein
MRSSKETDPLKRISEVEEAPDPVEAGLRQVLVGLETSQTLSLKGKKGDLARQGSREAEEEAALESIW